MSRRLAGLCRREQILLASVRGALERGDRVAATARKTDTLGDLVERYGDAILPLELDVTDRQKVFAAVASAHERFGSLDVVINNAGWSGCRDAVYGKNGLLSRDPTEPSATPLR